MGLDTVDGWSPDPDGCLDQFTVLWLHMCAVVLRVRTVGYSELVLKVVGNNRALLHVVCNIIRVAAQFGYMLGESKEGHERVQQCWKCGQATVHGAHRDWKCEGKALDCLGKFSLSLSKSRYKYYILRVCEAA